MIKSFQKRMPAEEHVVRIETGFILDYLAKGPSFNGWFKTSNNGKWYQLQVQMSYCFPNEKPILKILTPQRLYKYNSLQSLNDIGSSHDFHINGTDEDGNLEICHTQNWDASKSCVGIILKGCLWCEAYDYHLATGITIDDILKKIKENLKNTYESIKNILNQTLQENDFSNYSVPEFNFNIFSENL